jgi:hypothetical protein
MFSLKHIFLTRSTDKEKSERVDGTAKKKKKEEPSARSSPAGAAGADNISLVYYY